jgi:hypothetical protein
MCSTFQGINHVTDAIKFSNTVELSPSSLLDIITYYQCCEHVWSISMCLVSLRLSASVSFIKTRKLATSLYLPSCVARSVQDSL